ncbi:MAG: hypothetical protein QOD63_3134, partial [Actinomycetota bacterium]|nr:hypothetical protein [Actinomycetota bacterium]
MITTRLRRFKEKETQRIFLLLLGGKMLGVASV